MPVDVIFIPRHERNMHRNTLHEIAVAIYGTPEKTLFAEEFIPPGGRVPHEKVTSFTNYLEYGPNLLWAVRHDEQVVGFILIGDRPNHNSIGFSIDKAYAYQGVATAAFQLISNNPAIRYPLNAFTSCRNTASRRFLEKNNFYLVSDDIDFLGEGSCHYRIDG
jgi:RimJ/RimL family protein N-acetyltransferase